MKKNNSVRDLKVLDIYTTIFCAPLFMSTTINCCLPTRVVVLIIANKAKPPSNEHIQLFPQTCSGLKIGLQRTLFYF